MSTSGEVGGLLIFGSRLGSQLFGENFNVTLL